MKYFELFFDLNSVPDQWFLDEPYSNGSINIWDFVKSGTVNYTDLKIKVRVPGTPLDFTFGPFEILIVNSKVAKLMAPSDVQLLPVELINYESDYKYYVLVIKNEINCIDEDKSVFKKWEVGNDIRPDMAGQYHYFEKMVLHNKINYKYQIFRVKNYVRCVIISDELKNIFEANNVTGIKYTLVTPPH